MVSEITKQIIDRLPNRMPEVERQQEIGKLVDSMPESDRKALIDQYEMFLIYMRELDATDIELGGSSSLGRVWFRVYGKKKPKEELGLFSIDDSDVICHSLIGERQRGILLQQRSLDFSYHLNHNGNYWRWRASMYFDLGHLALNMRSIMEKIYPFKKLGIHPNIAKTLSLAHEKQGLILITGITGSGKSTTMDSIIDANNQTVDAHIVIIGSPIEKIHQSKKCIVRHREVGRDVLSFKEGAIQALRQDPDIIVVGEMRDAETISTCLEITDTGHKVFSTLHTCSAVETLDRIVAECPTEEQDRIRNRLADVLRVVMSQKLVPTIDGKIALAKEVLLVTASVKAAIRNRNTHEIYQMISESGELGMCTLEQDLKCLYVQRVITKETAMNYANNKNRMQELLEHSQHRAILV